MTDMVEGGGHRGITKSFEVDHARLLVSGCTGEPLADLADRVIDSPSSNRRRAVGKLVDLHVLGGHRSGVVWDCARLLALTGLTASDAAALCGLLYAANTALARAATTELVLPRIDAPEHQPPLEIELWRAFLAERLAPMSQPMFEKTRSTLVAMARKFGFIVGGPAGAVGEPLPYEVVPYQSRPELFLVALLVDFDVAGSTTRALSYVLGSDGPRSLLPVTRDFARYALHHGEQLGIVSTGQVGADVDVAVVPGAVRRLALELGG